MNAAEVPHQQADLLVDAQGGEYHAIYSACELHLLNTLEDVFHRLRQAGIPFCILRNRERIPSGILAGSDVDLILPANHSAQHLWSIIASLQPVHVVAHYAAIEVYLRAGSLLLHVDFLIADRQWRGARYLKNTTILETAADDNGMPVASKLHQAFCAWFSNLLRRKSFKPRYGPLIEEAAREHPEEFQRLLRDTFGDDLAGQLWQLATEGRLKESDDFAVRCRRAVWWRALRTRPFATLAGSFRHYAAELGQWLRPSGATIAVVGPDGAGKSAVCNTLIGATRAKLPFTGIEMQHLYRRVLPMLSELKSGRVRRSRATPVTVHDPHGKRPHPLPIALSTLTYCAVDNWLSRLRWAWFRLTRNKLLLHDRHMLELAIDGKRFRFGGPKWLARVITKCMPQPDLVVLLDAPASVLQSRKQEVPFDETARQCEAYREMVSSFPRGCIVNAAQLPEQVADDTREAIWKFLERRTACLLQRRKA